MPSRVRVRKRAARSIFLASSAIAICAVALAGCSVTPETPTPLRPAPTASPTGSPSASAAPNPGPVEPVGSPQSIATGLDVPWSIVFPHAGEGVSRSALVSERNSGVIREVTAAGDIRSAGTVPGVVAGGEGGLLGLAVWEAGDEQWLYAYFTAADDNRIARMPLLGAPGSWSLGAPEVIASGFARAGNHNGGRIAFGPDGMLYAAVGDAGVPERAQDPASPNGKIHRMTPTGGIPEGNPIAGSTVLSLGHRNPQGIAWDSDGRLWASEFGQNTWDELNLIVAGKNYGWPVVEGVADATGFENPRLQWATDEASPSGLAFVDGTLFMAALKGERLWRIEVPENGSAPSADQGDTALPAPIPYLQNQFGRLRDAALAPDGSLWLITNNTDGRGEPREGDDRVIRVQLAPTDRG